MRTPHLSISSILWDSPLCFGHPLFLSSATVYSRLTAMASYLYHVINQHLEWLRFSRAFRSICIIVSCSLHIFELENCCFKKFCSWKHFISVCIVRCSLIVKCLYNNHGQRCLHGKFKWWFPGLQFIPCASQYRRTNLEHFCSETRDLR